MQAGHRGSRRALAHKAGWSQSSSGRLGARVAAAAQSALRGRSGRHIRMWSSCAGGHIEVELAPEEEKCLIKGPVGGVAAQSEALAPVFER